MKWLDNIKTLIAVLALIGSLLTGLWKTAQWVQTTNDRLTAIEHHEIYFHGKTGIADANQADRSQAK